MRSSSAISSSHSAVPRLLLALVQGLRLHDEGRHTMEAWSSAWRGKSLQLQHVFTGSWSASPGTRADRLERPLLVLHGTSDVNVPYDFFRPCRNREWAGERNHNWCYRCLAGCFLVEMHVYDAERTSDRAIRMSQ